MSPHEGPAEPLPAWIDRQHRHAATAILRSVSPLDRVKSRPGFGQTIGVKRGAIVASPVLAAYDPDPDYFFHWYRDSAVVVDALGLLFEQTGGSGAEAAALLGQFADFVHFSLALRELDGRALAVSPTWRARVRPDFVQFLRPDTELAAVHDEDVAADTRVNPDGTLDISRWGRPQHDGPALRALAVLRWMRRTPLGSELSTAASTLLGSDLAFARRRARAPCFDIWEEEHGLHYYTLNVSAAALDAGADWLDDRGERDEGQASRAEAAAIYRALDGYWLENERYYRSRVLSSGARSAKELDISVVLAALHGSGRPARHSVRDPRILATLARLEALFDAEYPINAGRPPSRAPALGRYSGDVYYSGGAYYFSTLGAAELCYRAAAGTDAGEREARALFHRGEAYLETVRAYTPPSGDLSEQFDRRTGAQTSAKDLAWSYAAFISAIAARRAALTSRPAAR